MIGYHVIMDTRSKFFIFSCIVGSDTVLRVAVLGRAFKVKTNNMSNAISMSVQKLVFFKHYLKTKAFNEIVTNDLYNVQANSLAINNTPKK